MAEFEFCNEDDNHVDSNVSQENVEIDAQGETSVESVVWRSNQMVGIWNDIIIIERISHVGAIFISHPQWALFLPSVYLNPFKWWVIPKVKHTITSN